jgi:hypothetical protein
MAAGKKVSRRINETTNFRQYKVTEAPATALGMPLPDEA